MVRGTAGRFRYNTRKTQYRQIQFIDEGIDNANRVIFPDVVVQAIRQQDELAPVLTLNKTLHPVPPNPEREYQIGRFHTVWPLFRRCWLGQLEGAPSRRGRGNFGFPGHLHGRESEFDAVLVERLLDHCVGLAANHELLARHRNHFRPDLNREIARRDPRRDGGGAITH